MAAIFADCDPKAIYATVNKEPRDSGSGARIRPPGDLKLARSLSKSDSDLLVSPPSEDEGGLGNRSESVSNCSSGKKRLEKSPSFTSEWDEVSGSDAVCDQSVLYVDLIYVDRKIKHTFGQLLEVKWKKSFGICSLNYLKLQSEFLRLQ